MQPAVNRSPTPVPSASPMAAPGGLMLSSPSCAQTACSPSTATNSAMRNFDMLSVGTTASFPSPPPSILSREKFRLIKNAQNIGSLATKQLKWNWIVFCTAMMYFHHVLHGLRVEGVERLHVVNVMCACLLLASKTEHSKLKLNRLIEIVYAINPATQAEDCAKYRETVLALEMVVCSHLDFEFQQPLPLERMSAMAKTVCSIGGVADPLRGETVPDAAALNSHAQKLYSYVLLSPVVLSYTEDVIADSLILLVAESFGIPSDRLPQVDATACAQVEQALAEVLEYGDKTLKLPALDERLSRLRSGKRTRTE